MTPTPAPLLDTSLDGLTLHRRGKVRDVYELGDDLLIVDDRSHFGVRLRARLGHPRQGQGPDAALRVLVRAHGGSRSRTTCCRWMSADFPAPARAHAALLQGRAMLVRRTEPVPIECVARGYLSGSGWKEYQADRARLRHYAAGRAAGVGSPARADLHAGDQGRHRPRREHQRRTGRATGRARRWSSSSRR